MTMTTTKPQPMPPAVRRALVDAGKLDADRYRRRASLATCKHCRQVVIAGLDDEPCGLPTRADPMLLTWAQELYVLANGRATYDLINGPMLQYRDDFRIRAQRRYPVVPHHACGTVVIPDTEVVRLFTKHTYQPTSEEPPF